MFTQDSGIADSNLTTILLYTMVIDLVGPSWMLCLPFFFFVTFCWEVVASRLEGSLVNGYVPMLVSGSYLTNEDLRGHH